MRTSSQFGRSILGGGGYGFLEMKVYIVVEPALFLRKHEATKVNANMHQGETRVREIQCQGKMDSYTGTVSVMRAIFMGIFPINSHIKNLN